MIVRFILSTAIFVKKEDVTRYRNSVAFGNVYVVKHQGDFFFKFKLQHQTQRSMSMPEFECGTS